jgi:DNA-binding response OmpR family regulator
MNILLLEDDYILSESLEVLLTKEGYSVDVALSIEDAERLTFENSYGLYIFDINLPKGSGLELLEALQFAEDTTPTIFITSLIDMDSLAKGFALGAIDYIKKPFDPEELLIRIAAKFTNDTIRYKHLEYDVKSHMLWANKVLVDLGNVQLHIFDTLIQNIGTLVPKDDLYIHFDHVSDTALRVAITKLKQKLGIDIKNIRGKGYLLEKV